MPASIRGIQQVGIGVGHMAAAWTWYRRYFGMDIPVFQEAAEAPLMSAYTGGTVHSRNATLAINLQGGGGMEIWQFTSRTPAGPAGPIALGDYGIFAARVKARDVAAAHRHFTEAGLDVCMPVSRDPAGRPHFFVRDPFGNTFDIVTSDSWFAAARRSVTGGVAGALIGVSDIEKARALYSEVLGYSRVIYEKEGIFDDLLGVRPEGNTRMRRVLLAPSYQGRGGFAPLFGASEIELVKVFDRIPTRIFQNRYWGDLGFIHLCFDIHGMSDLERQCRRAGFPFVVDSMNSFDMGEASGHFSYIEDPDGTLIEFVEAHRVPIMKRWNWYLDLRKRPADKPLPRWMIRAMGVNRFKE
jgi:catechol 2,3-dioxygenase-like lactoylglutathione lyase family enzyme